MREETTHNPNGNVSHLEAIQAVTDQRQAVLQNEPNEILVPEWPIQGAPMRVYAWPPTVEEEAEINQRRIRAVQGARDGAYEEILATLIVRAKNKDGSRIFDFAQLPDLRGAMGDTVRRVVRELNGVGLTPEEVAGN
jgi:hypothetical protein